MGSVILALDSDAGPSLIVFDLASSDHVQKIGRGGVALSELDAVVDVMLGRQQHPQAKFVSWSEVAESDSSLHPTRYLHSTAVSGPSIPFRKLFDVVRPPSMRAVGPTVEAIEIGTGDIDQQSWLPIKVGDDPKVIAVAEKSLDAVQLRAGDLILTIKGTVGRCQIYGPDDPLAERPAVLAQTCIALRPRSVKGHRDDDTAIALMYLRSDLGQQVLRSLQTGATVAQLNPGVLLDDMRLPLLSPEPRAALLGHYLYLQRADTQIALWVDRKVQVVRGLWSLQQSPQLGEGLPPAPAQP